MTRIVRGVARRHAVKTMSGSVGAWWTPPEYALEVARWAQITPGMRVLDLGAGIGSLTRAALACGATVTALEVDGSLEGRLRERVGERAHVVIGDAFNPDLALGSFDLVLTNPKWEQDFEVRFLMRALELAPRVVGIISLDGLVSSGRDERGWKHMRITRELLAPARLSFSMDGSSGQEWPIAVDVMRRASPRSLGTTDVIERSYYVPPRRVA